MPVMQGISGLAQFGAYLSSVYQGLTITAASADRIVVENQNIRVVFAGTDLSWTSEADILSDLTGGTLQSIRFLVPSTLKALGSISNLGLVIDTEEGGAFANAASLRTAIANMEWTIKGTAKADEFYLSDTSTFHMVAPLTLKLLAGADSAQGGLGNDRILAGGGNDVIYDSKGNDTIDGGTGNDLLGGDLGGNDSIAGGTGADTIDGGRGADRLYGNNDNDSISGGSGKDILFGGTGNDTLNGGAGNDRLTGDAGADHFVFTGNFGRDVVSSFQRVQDRLVIEGDYTVSHARGDTILKLDGGTIILDNINLTVAQVEAVVDQLLV